MQRKRQEKQFAKMKIKRIVDLSVHKLGILHNHLGTEDRCYAKSLGNCKGGLSKEHYISESLLKHFNKIPSSSIPWMSHKTFDVPPEVMTTKCLCQYHNNFLSPLDGLIDPFFKQVKRFGYSIQEKTIISGSILERWLLKTLIGLISTGKYQENGKTFDVSDFNEIWINVLFGRREFPEGTGLFIFHKPGEKISFKNAFTIYPVILGNEICGLNAKLAGLSFMLSLVPKNKAFQANHTDYPYVLHKPNGYNKKPHPQEIAIVWP